MNNGVEIGNRIKEMREKANITQEELGLALGLNKSTIQRYESGKISRIKLPVLEAMAQKLDVCPEYLALKTDEPTTYKKKIKIEDLFCGMGELLKSSQKEKPYFLYSGEPTNREQRRSIKKDEQNIEVVPENNIYMIPVYESVSAGFGAYACSDVIEYTPLVINNPADASDMLCIKVDGDSMYPKIENGDTIVVRKQSSVDNGQIAVILIDNEEGVVKKISYGNDWIELISINPMYPPRRFEGPEIQRINIVGLVKQIIKNI